MAATAHENSSSSQPVASSRQPDSDVAGTSIGLFSSSWLGSTALPACLTLLSLPATFHPQPACLPFLPSLPSSPLPRGVARFAWPHVARGHDRFGGCCVMAWWRWSLLASSGDRTEKTFCLPCYLVKPAPVLAACHPATPFACTLPRLYLPILLLCAIPTFPACTQAHAFLLSPMPLQKERLTGKHGDSSSSQVKW